MLPRIKPNFQSYNELKAELNANYYGDSVKKKGNSPL